MRTHRIVVAPPLASSSGVRVAHSRPMPYLPLLTDLMEAMTASLETELFSPGAI